MILGSHIVIKTICLTLSDGPNNTFAVAPNQHQVAADHSIFLGAKDTRDSHRIKKSQLIIKYPSKLESWA